MCCYSMDSFCCMKLRTAGLVIGWVSGVISLIQSVIYITILATLDQVMENFKSRGVIDGALVGIMATGFSVVISIHLAVSLLDLISSILVIIGCKKDSHFMLLPWLINNGFSAIMKICILIYFTLPSSEKVPVWIGVILIILGVQCWSWTGICSVFRSIRASRDEILENNKQAAGAINYELFKNPECACPNSQ